MKNGQNGQCRGTARHVAKLLEQQLWLLWSSNNDFFTSLLKKQDTCKEKPSGWSQTLPPKHNAAATFGEKGRMTRGQPRYTAVKDSGTLKKRKNSRLCHRLLLGENIRIFFIPTSREAVVEGTVDSTNLYLNTELRPMWGSCYRPNYIIRLEGEMKM